VWQRLRRLLESAATGDALRTANFLDPAPAGFESGVKAIEQNAAAYLARARPDAKSRASVELFLYALTRVARSDADGAASALEKFADKLAPADLAFAWAQLALYGSMQQSLHCARATGPC
jgi:hypothetical protein